MILSGGEDLRVVKTMDGIKRSFRELICEKPYEKITVTELCARAQINKKTFYHYYETLDALLSEMQLEMGVEFLNRVKGCRLPEDMATVNREFFAYSIEQGEAYEKITLSAGWQGRRDQMIAQVNDVGWAGSESYQRLPDFEKGLLMDFLNGSTLAAYRLWVEGGKTLPVDEVLDTLNCLQSGGLTKFFGERRL